MLDGDVVAMRTVPPLALVRGRADVIAQVREGEHGIEREAQRRTGSAAGAGRVRAEQV